MADPCKSPIARPAGEKAISRDMPPTDQAAPPTQADRPDEMEPIDLDRVITDPAYRRRVIAYLNRR